MHATITSEIIGTLTQNEQFDDWWESNPIHVPLLDEKLKVTFMNYIPDHDPLFSSQADLALNNFLQLSSDYLTEIATYVYDNYKEFASMVGEDDLPSEMNTINTTEIWNFVQFQELYVSRRSRRDQDIYITVACECDWEIEHGLQFVFRQGKKLTRVSDQDGHETESDAYDIPDSEDKLLSAF